MKTAILGLTYGDEGKGRVSGCFVKNAAWSVKFNGGGNSGHSVFDDDGNLHKFHHLTAGAAFGKKVAIDTGAVVDLNTLKGELENIGKEVDLYISENVHVVQPEHLEQDADGSGIGSTKRGISYVYADRALRKGKRVTQEDLMKYGIRATIYRGLPPIAKDEDAVFEGAQGLQLDVDFGDYNFVTSSSIMPSSAHRIDKFVGVMKAYTTRVGDGPPYHPDMEDIRIAGNEFGVTTKRPRKTTWNDMDQLDYALSIVQPDEVVVTKLDILKDMKEICVYRDGELYTVGNLDSYKNFLLENIPQIRWFSESPKGDLIDVKAQQDTQTGFIKYGQDDFGQLQLGEGLGGYPAMKVKIK